LWNKSLRKKHEKTVDRISVNGLRYKYIYLFYTGSSVAESHAPVMGVKGDLGVMGRMRVVRIMG